MLAVLFFFMEKDWTDVVLDCVVKIYRERKREILIWSGLSKNCQDTDWLIGQKERKESTLVSPLGRTLVKLKSVLSVYL